MKRIKKKNSSINHKESKEQQYIRLNKFLSNAGVSSRREADRLIEAGLVKVNGKVVSELGAKIVSTDKITLKGKQIISGRPVYILLNKPKDFITTTKDEKGRRTVMELISRATTEKVYPVGRLDRNSTGLLLFTNDGELANSLTHPSSKVEKIYAVDLDKPLTHADMEKAIEGVDLEDGFFQVDEIAYTDEKDRRKTGVRIHSGRNRIIRRLFEHLGYRVEKLDRVVFAMLTKDNLPRGKWRFLTEKEVNWLKRKFGNKKDVEKPRFSNKR